VARPQLLDDNVLIDRLSTVFQDVGYAGASLGMLADCTGLQKASLYHRFPGGKQEMAEKVLDTALGWFAEHVLQPLERPGDPRARLSEVVRNLDGFYAGGARACLLNMLASPRTHDGPFSSRIKKALRALIQAFARVATDAGLPSDRARHRAERTVALIQGSLVLARGLGSPTPFQNVLAALPSELLE
jgi:TetR/AcrR family transcriptional repressor of lmrAB and yxaGH operons